MHYFILKVVKALPIDQIKLIQLYGKIVNYVFNGYSRGRKGYEHWEVKFEG